MADESQWVFVFADVDDSMLHEFVRCTCIDGLERFTKELQQADRQLHRYDKLCDYLLEGELRSGYLIAAELFDSIVGNFVALIKDKVENAEELSEYLQKELETREIQAIVDETLTFRAFKSTFDALDRQRKAIQFQFVKMILSGFTEEEVKENIPRSILSRAYKNDELVFKIKRGKVLLKKSRFAPFSIIFYNNEDFSKKINAFILWAILSNSILMEFMTCYSKSCGEYFTTIQLLFDVGKKYVEYFGADLLDDMENGISMNGMTVRVMPTMEELLGEVSRENIVVPAQDVKMVIMKIPEPPAFLPINGDD